MSDTKQLEVQPSQEELAAAVECNPKYGYQISLARAIARHTRHDGKTAAMLAGELALVLPEKTQPCGCVLCFCEGERCQGCDAKFCSDRDCNVRKGILTYVNHPLKAERDAALAGLEKVRATAIRRIESIDRSWSLGEGATGYDNPGVIDAADKELVDSNIAWKEILGSLSSTSLAEHDAKVLNEAAEDIYQKAVQSRKYGEEKSAFFCCSELQRLAAAKLKEIKP